MSELWKLRRVAILLALAAALVLAAAACGGGDGDEGAEEAETTEAGQLPSGTYKIGFVESITGRLAFYDPIFARGMKVAIEQINDKGGVDGRLKLQLIERDGKSDPAAGAVAARELMAQDVQFAVTPCDADIGIPGAQIFQRDGIPVVMACDLSSNDYFYGKNTSDVFESRFKELGGKIVCHVFYKLTDSDFRAVATQIARANPDVVTTTLVFPGSTTFLKQVRAQGYQGPFIWSDAIDSKAALAAGAALKDVYFTTHACPTDSTTSEFFDAFQQKTGKAPDANFVATGGDLVKQIEAALLEAKSTDPSAVRDAYAGLKDVKGISGTISYAGAPLPRNPVKDVHVLKWENREQKCVKSFYPEEVPAIE